MAIQQAVGFSMQIQGDGTSTTFEISLPTAAICFQPSSAGAVFQPGFNLTGLKPSGVVNVSCPSGPTVESAELGGLLNTELTIEFEEALASGTVYGLTGTLLF